jgi:hypothetical protein
MVGMLVLLHSHNRRGSIQLHDVHTEFHENQLITVSITLSKTKIDEWMDGWMDGWMERNIHRCLTGFQTKGERSALYWSNA